MKKLPLLITIGLVISMVSGYFIYDRYFQKKLIGPWDVVPSGTVLVYESSECADCIEQVKESSLWKIIYKAAFYSRNTDSLKTIFDFLSKPRSGSLVSMHVTRKDDFDFVFYQLLINPSEKEFLNNTVQQWKNNKQIKFSERELNSVRIHEMTFSHQVFSWVFIDNVWIGSFTPFLIEDVVRTYESGNPSFRKDISDVYQLPRIKKDAGNLYVHLKNLSEWISAFESDQSSPILRQLGKSSVLDIKNDDNRFVLNGFSLDSITGDKSILSVFNTQDPTPFELKRYISNRSVIACLYGISDGENLSEKLESFSETKRPHWKDTLQHFSKLYKVDIQQLYKTIGGEVGVSFVESRGQQASRILMVQVKDPAIWLTSLNGIAERLSEDTVFVDKFSDYDIHEMPLYRFPEKIFWPLISGFDHCYYTHQGNTIFFGENLEELKKYLDDIDHEDTWGKSVSQNQFLESTLLEANISLYVNTPRVWSILSQSLHPRWKQFIQENQQLVRSLGMGAIQFSHLNQSFYTNISWAHKAASVTESKANNKERLVVNFERLLISKPIVVKNHTTKGNEVLVQDSAYNLHLVSADGTVLWKVNVGSSIKGEVDQIDYFNNGKLQYAFATQGMLHVVDRLGKYVSPFPLKLNTRDSEHLSVVDYDHSRKYRFLIADKSGKLWMYDKEGKNLEGWKPKSLEGSMVVSPRHHRIRGRDYILAISKTGKVYLMNRKGEMLKNFPLNIESIPAGNYFLESGNSISNTYFVLVTRDGFKIKFNLEGKIQSRETLIKTSVDARFELISEHSDKGYIVARQELKQLILLDDTGKEIVKNEFIGLNPVDIQYFDFGAGRIFVAITDKIQDLSFIYNNQGELLTSPPEESQFINLRVGEHEQLFSVYHKSLTIRPL